MSPKKRAQEEGDEQKRKKQKVSNENASNENASMSAQPLASVLSKDEVDFPRGGGSNFTPVEYKQIRAEAIKELKDEVFKDADSSKKRSKQKDRKGKSASSNIEHAGKGKKKAGEKSGEGRIEHLNYKRITVGMKIFCQVMAIYPLALIVSLPDQLLGHIPITQVSNQLTAALEAMDEEEDNSDASDDEGDGEKEGTKKIHPPDLMEIFQPGQFVSAIVTAVKSPGTTEGRSSAYARDDTEKTSRRVELSVIPSQVNAGLVKTDLKLGFTLNAAINGVEDHGYILDLGAPTGVSGFLPFKKAGNNRQIPVGALLRVSVDKLTDDGRTCTLNADQQLLRTSMVKEISNVTSLLPGLLVQALVTSVSPLGLNVEILGSFSGTVDLSQIPQGDVSNFVPGKKIKARVLYEIAGSSPPQFALSTCDHVVSLKSKTSSDGKEPLEDAFPVGTQIPSVKVKRVESERGLFVEVQDGIYAFVHISHVSDEHVPSLPSTSGKWKIGSSHPARVIGHHPFDGILQLSMRNSVLEQKFLRVDDVQVGEIVKGTVRKLTDNSLFVRINGNVDGMIWPLHFADIMLKHPQKRFKKDSDIKCRVLAVDASRKRILLTAKKTLVETELPIITRIEDAKVDLVTIGVVCKILDKSLIVEFFNNVRGIVPAREASETPLVNLSESFTLGKPVKVRIIQVNPSSSRIVASIRKLSSDVTTSSGDIENIEVGQVVSGAVSEIAGENVHLLLHPNNTRALMSLKNIANSRNTTVDQLRSSLAKGEELNDLVVVSRNTEKGFVLVANKPSKGSQSAPRQPPLDIKTVSTGMQVVAQVVRHTNAGALLKFPGSGSRLTGMLHCTDVSDNFSEGSSLPAVGSVVKGVVVAVDKEKKQIGVSTRKSRTQTGESTVVDPEVGDIKDLKVDAKIRGFIKSIADHGVFVSVGRGIDARVQIKELYDEYVTDWKKGFEVNQLVEGKIVSVETTKRQVEMTFRSGPVKRNLTISDLEVGQKINGSVRKIADYGVFVTIENTKLTGLCHKSEIADDETSDVGLALKNFREGDAVRAIVLKIDVEKKQISLGLKPSYFAADDDDEPSEDQDTPDAEDSSVDIIMEQAASDNDDDDSGDERMVVDEQSIQPVSVETEVPTQRDPAKVLPALSLQGGFQWHAMDGPSGANNEEDSSSDDDEGQSEHKKKKRKKAIEYDVTGEMHTKLPDSVSDFERRLLGSPNSSYLWIQYMSFQLQLSEVDRAREIGRRALRTINMREEQEKLNVWIAMLNLENTFGTEESLEAAFKEATRMCDSKTVHLRLATILDESQKQEKAEDQYKRTSKKFGQSSKVWTLFCEHYLKRGQIEEARALLPRSLQSLEKRKHLKTISKFAILEYKLGEPERGKTLFEGIIDSHPKRFDLWSVYMDMEASQKDIQSLRNLFERVLEQKMTSHKAKAFFKKWLTLEQRIGDEEGQQTVKDKAIEWTQRVAKS